MKKKYLIIIPILLIISITIYIIINKNINIKQQKILWNIYDNNLENIKNNLDPITNPNEFFYWWELKDFNIEDKYYKQTLNNLVAHIRMCYLELTDDGSLYTNSNPIRNYKEKEFITKKELETLNFNMYNEFNQGCLKSFNSYYNIILSEDKENSSNLLNKLNKLELLKETTSLKTKTATYNELLQRKILETNILEDLSEYIVIEYYRLK